jgi:NADP-dependent 3-hydroxy acid dehydrogenase YdfG
MARFPSVFITGASSGLGRGLALHYARAGSTVHAAARRTAQLEALKAEAPPGSIVPVELDVSNIDALDAAIGRAEAASGGALDLVIANAGIGGPTPASHIDFRDVERMLHLNVTAACVTIARALPAMVGRGRGQVVAISSIAGYRGLPGHGAYCASKAALSTFMESVRVDLRGTGVRATTIAPGFVKTELTAKATNPMPFLMELDDAVRVMARAIDRGQPRLAYPWPSAWVLRAVSRLPGIAWEPIGALLRGVTNRGQR